MTFNGGNKMSAKKEAMKVLIEELPKLKAFFGMNRIGLAESIKNLPKI